MPSQQLLEIILKAKDEASNVAKKVDDSLEKVGKTSNLLGRVPGLNGLSQKLSGIGTTIKGKLSPHLDKARMKLEQLSKGSKGLGNSFGFLKSALSMTVGMIGFDLVNGIMQSARASINAASQVEYFGQRLNKVTGQAHMTTEQFNKFKGELGDLQKEFRKVDMTAVGATAEELALKMDLPAEKIGDLTRLTAVMSSTFVKEGRSQEDAVLAVSDAMDGQFRRLQEIGITQQKLKDNGWTGNLEDQESLMDALNKTMQEMGYEQTAKDITNLDEAMTALNIAGGQLLQKILVPLTPVLISVVDALLRAADAVTPLIEGFAGFVANMPDWAKIASLALGFAVALTYVKVALWEGLIQGLAGAALAAWDFAAAMLTFPGTWIVLALAAVAIAVYEVGKAFGWWTDINSMLSAIWAGIQRLWSAFINHPDVQGMLSVMAQAWNWLSGAVGNAIKWVMSFFKVSSSGNFDFVRALIDALGTAWKATTAPIRLVITVVKLFYTTMNTVYNKVKAILNNIKKLFSNLPSSIRGAIGTLVGILTNPVKTAYGMITGTVGSIKNTLSGITHVNLGSLTNKITQPVTNAYNKIAKTVSSIIQKIKSIPSNIPGIGGAFGFDYEGMMEELSKGKSASYSATGNDKLELDHNINFTFDFNNLPDGTSEETLVAMLRSAITDRSVINSLVN
ncbi:MAG: hypothetical protein J6W71_06650, partial [Methanobrevibacter sp.]|nr:hypothetical protein [Methanobrevibacter sp.]